MLLVDHRQSIFPLIIVIFNLFTNIHCGPLNDLSTAQSKDSIYNQLIKGQHLIVHEERGVVFSRVGYYYEIDDIFGLTITVPVTQYLCPILPMEQMDKLSLCVDYQQSLRSKIEQEERLSQSSLSDFLNSTNNTRFSAERVPIRTHHRHHHQRSKRLIPMIVGIVVGAVGALLGGVSLYNTIKGAQLSTRVSEIQRFASETNSQLHSIEVSVLTNTNTTVQLARSFNKAQENMETMRNNMETIVKHISRLDSFAEAQTRYNLKTHAESVYERMKNSMRRIERNDLNLDFVGMTEKNEILEIVYDHLKHSIPSATESKATFISRMLFAQTVEFLPSKTELRTNDTTGYYPEYLGNIVFTSFFSVLKINTLDKMQVYKLTTLPFYTVEKETGKELFGLPKMIGVSNGGYIEWREIVQQSVCDFSDYTVCRDPPVIQKRINNRCLEQLISTNRSFHCRVQDSLYSPPHFERIASDVMVLSTRTPINCTTTEGFHIFKNLSIVHLSCNDTFYCDNNINFIGNKRCQMLKPYIIKTINEEVIPVVDSIRPLNMSLTNVYPFASDKNLILTLEEQMRIEQKNIRETEKTGHNLFKLPNLSETRSLLITLTVALSTLAILVILVVLYVIYRCRRNHHTSPTSIVNIGTTADQSDKSTSLTTADNLGSLHDLLRAFAKNKKNKQ
jgi:hypothetical protein